MQRENFFLQDQHGKSRERILPAGMEPILSARVASHSVI